MPHSPFPARPLWLLAGKAAVSGCLVLTSLAVFAQSAPKLDKEAADTLVTAFYSALTAPAADAISALLDQATDPQWTNCSTNETCETKAQTLRRWKERIAVVPNLQWERQEVIVAGSRIVVRGEASGVPATKFMGCPPRGRSFHVMTIDIHDVEHGKIIRTYHLENWTSAARQLANPVN